MEQRTGGGHSSAGAAPGRRDPGRQPCSDTGLRGANGEAAILPREHLADVITVDQAAAGEPPRHPHAHRLEDRCDGVRRQCRRGPEANGFAVTS